MQQLLSALTDYLIKRALEDGILKTDIGGNADGKVGKLEGISG